MRLASKRFLSQLQSDYFAHVACYFVDRNVASQDAEASYIRTKDSEVFFCLIKSKMVQRDSN